MSRTAVPSSRDFKTSRRVGGDSDHRAIGFQFDLVSAGRMLYHYQQRA